MTIAEDAGSAVLDRQDRTGAAGPRPPRQPTRRRVAVALLLLAALAVAWWWSHPRAFGGPGGEFGARPERLTPVYVVMVELAGHDVELIAGEPRVRVFGGEVQTEVLLCDGANIGIVYGDDAERRCAAPADHRRSTDWDQVVLRFTPSDAGTVAVVDGIDLTYRTGLQRGTEHVGWAGAVVFPLD
ncbi:hypothetical protein [Ornithinimicrobium pekingense]|uniref:Uncharacterized protein n=1 Tax=Ornithinimicrobium pekingense TaxID=384677 RepID=A0ABQ2F9Z7_9MICO|nr:hypothetical protein [Ornithinimicrobium pekingense]GGK71911.1 hypothetical protein GCM10011509_20650 [Ornithinimicrobium pekingense]